MSAAVIKYDRWAIAPCIPRKVGFDVRDWDEVSHILLNDWKIYYNGKDMEFRLTLRAGFITDGGSVPKFYWNRVAPWGLNVPAFLTHDGIYSGELMPRDVADWVLLEIMESCGETWIKRNTAWSTVKTFGSTVWDKHTGKSIDEARKLMLFEPIRGC